MAAMTIHHLRISQGGGETDFLNIEYFNLYFFKFQAVGTPTFKSQYQLSRTCKGSSY